MNLVFTLFVIYDTGSRFIFAAWSEEKKYSGVSDSVKNKIRSESGNQEQRNDSDLYKGIPKKKAEK